MRWLVVVVATVLLGACGGASLPPNPPRQLVVSVGADGYEVRDDILQLGARLVFSTAESRSRGPQSVVIVNGADTPLAITDIVIDGPGFELVDDPVTGELAPGESSSIPVEFVPVKSGLDRAGMTVVIDRRPPVQIELRGLDAEGIEGSSEPDLQMIFDAFGFEVDVAMPPEPPSDIDVSEYDNANSISRSPRAVGDEVLIPYFTRADESQPVRLLPLANYISRSGDDLGWFGIHARDDFARTQRVVAFRGGDDELGGQNQQLLPGIGSGNYDELVDGSDVTFTPQFEPFAVWDGERNVSTDDAVNDRGGHGMRVYPARTAAGAIPNAYLVADDSGLPDFKNYDYQDVVFLLTNVRAAP